MEEFQEEKRFVKKIVYWIIGLTLVLSTAGYIVHKVREATKIDTAVITTRSTKKFTIPVLR